MISVQANCSTADAYELLKARARSTARSLEHVATDVIERRLTFAPPSRAVLRE
jgi:hypothetical protein